MFRILAGFRMPCGGSPKPRKSSGKWSAGQIQRLAPGLASVLTRILVHGSALGTNDWLVQVIVPHLRPLKQGVTRTDMGMTVLVNKSPQPLDALQPSRIHNPLFRFDRVHSALHLIHVIYRNRG